MNDSIFVLSILIILISPQKKKIILFLNSVNSFWMIKKYKLDAEAFVLVLFVSNLTDRQQLCGFMLAF